MPPADGVALAAALATGAALGIVWVRLMRRHTNTGQHTPAIGPIRPPALAPPEPDPVAPPVSEGLGGQLSAAFRTWREQRDDFADPWSSFDQLIRELLAEHLGATRIRCYRLPSGSESLTPLARSSKDAAGEGPSAREGLLGHVATAGKEFVAGDRSLSPLLHDLAARSADAWAWIWPIRTGSTTIGLIAVGNLRTPDMLTPAARRTIGQIISFFWQHVACLEQLCQVRRTDQASGVLTRAEFFDLARVALADSYRENEPVVVVVLALEGLRRLDDTGCWRERDAVVERLGHVIMRRLRSDDLVGRFADDRFVLLLRRLDSGLGRLIAEKIAASTDDCAGGSGPAGDGRQRSADSTRLRVGLAGSGFAQPPLESLLVAAFAAVDRARRENVTIETDLADHRPEAPVEAGTRSGFRPAAGGAPAEQGGAS